MGQKYSLSLAGAVALTAVINADLQAQAVKFNFSYGQGTSLEQIVGFETAAGIWSSYLTDDVTVNLHVGVSNTLSDKVVGGALPGMQAFQSYEGFYNSLHADKTSADDYTAAQNLQAHRHADGHLRYNAIFEQGNTWHNKNIALTNANAKALGLLTNSNALDGSILLNDLSNTKHKWNYDFNRDDSEDKKSLDFLSVALHEIGHTLGFVSSVDAAEKSDSQASYSENIDRLMNTTTLDMFRYSDYSKRKDTVELAVGEKSYFSIDGGNTKIADFARGKKDFGLGSDGFQGSHWKDNKKNQLGIMGPTIRNGERRDITALDLQALDVIGWDLNANASINLNVIEAQAKQRIAQKIADKQGWGTGYGSWIDSYINNGQNDSAAAWLTSDRTSELDQMIRDSELYEIGYGQLFQEVFLDNAYHSTLDDSSDLVAVPEPSMLGLMGLTAFMLTRSRRQNP
ncbi:MAG: NF038122 family metalloprotease [Phormidesmis sp.]